jgi:hypothetical protein
MKLTESKFNVLLEYALSRYQMGGFLVGDLVVIKPSALKHEEIASRGQTFKEQIEARIKSKQHLRVSYVKSIRQDTPGRPANSGAADYYVDVVEEYAPGLFHNVFTLPAEVLEVVDYGINMPPAAGMRRKSKSEKIKEDPHNDILGTYPMDNSLAKTNTKIANSNKWPDVPGGRTQQKY